MVNAATADDRLADAANGGGAGLVGDFQRNLQADFAVRMNARSNVNVHAHVEILKLRVYTQRAYSRADAKRSSKRTGGDGNAVADFQAGLEAVCSANLRILQDLGVRVVEQKLHMDRINAYRVVSGIQMLQTIKVQPAATRGRCGSSAARSSRGGSRVSALECNGCVLRRQDADLPDLIVPYLGYNYVNDDFRFGFVNVINHLLRQRQLVWSATYHDGILRGYLLDALHFQNRADRIHHVLKIGCRGHIAEIKGSNDALLEFATLAGIIRSNKDGVWRYRTPERPRLQRNDVQCLLQSDALQIHRKLSRGVIRIEENVDAGKLANGFVNGP